MHNRLCDKVDCGFDHTTFQPFLPQTIPRHPSTPTIAHRDLYHKLQQCGQNPESWVCAKSVFFGGITEIGSSEECRNKKKWYPPTHESKWKREKGDRSREREREWARVRANSNEECSVVYMTTSTALKRHFWDSYFRRERNNEWVGGFCFFIWPLLRL